MKQLIVGISDLKVSNDPDTVLVTYSLGSCITIMAYDRVHKVGGMFHFRASGTSTPDNDSNARDTSSLFSAEAGLPKLVEQMCALGANKKYVTLRAAGGGQIGNDKNSPHNSQRNYTILRKVCWKSGILISSEDIGGDKPRLARLYIGSGKVTITTDGNEIEMK